jgi:hypothetical protein
MQALKIEAKAIAFTLRFLEPIQVLHNSFGISFPSNHFSTSSVS